jgi:hypothetical protein
VALPPAKPGRLARSQPSDDAPRSRREKDPLDLEARALEEELEALKARYDQYFLGIERREPVRWREEIRKKVMRLKGEFTRNTGLKFRIQTLHARYLSYERLWLRSAREKEEGTYRRDLFKARLRHHEQPAAPAAREAASAAPAGAAPQKAAPAAKKAGATPIPAAAARPVGAPAVAAASPSPPPLPHAAAKPARPAAPAPPPSASGGMTDPQMRALYSAYLAAKMTCREDVSKLTYDAVAKSVSKQIPELMARFKAKSVDFRVEVKDGKAILKAIPKV